MVKAAPDETVEGEAREIPPERSLVPHNTSGLVVGGDIAELSDEAFNDRLKALQKQQQRIQQIKLAAMIPGSDYGNVPGTSRPTLLKGGAEKLCNLFGLVARIDVKREIGDGIIAPQIRYQADAFIHVGTFDGPIVAVGHGSASSWETKYRWRKASIECPDCLKPGVVMTRRHVWWHPDDAKPDGGCGANFVADDSRLTSQAKGRQENEDPYELDNTLLKMAEKRAHVDGTLRATGTSGVFTQDMEDTRRDPIMPDEPEENDWTRNGFVARAKRRYFENAEIMHAAKDCGFEGKKLPDLSDEERHQLFDQIMENRAEDATPDDPDRELENLNF